MPALNTIKPYEPNGIYHLYNRGIEKRIVFQDAKDHNVFVSLLKRYLFPEKQKRHGYNIDLLSYCLMPNHFHLLVKQYNDNKSIAKFMRCLISAYAVYFNSRHDRRGNLFEKTYRGILVPSDIYLLHLSRYIHLNPSKIAIDPYEFNYSSLKNYIGKTKNDWIKTDLLLEYFDQTFTNSFTSYKSYEDFLK